MAASLFPDPPPDLSLTASNSTCTLLHPVCSLFTANSSLYSPLTYHQKLPFFSTSFSLCLLHPPSVFLTLFSSLFFGGGGGVLERCSVTAKCLLRGAKKSRGRGNLWETGGGPAAGSSPGALLDCLVPHQSECFCRLFCSAQHVCVSSP